MGCVSQGRSQARDPPRGGRRGGQDDFDTLTGRRPAIFCDGRRAMNGRKRQSKNFFCKIFQLYASKNKHLQGNRSLS
jgi:hypothetical protein